MGKRPRGLCRMCLAPRSGRWNGDVLIVSAHFVKDDLCPGSGRPEWGEPEPANVALGSREQVRRAG